jgi:tetratricopeptide (TPR) repeat protein
MATARSLAGIVAIAIFTVAPCARGSDTPADASAAERLFYTGLDALNRHDYEHARQEFEASVALAPRGSALRNLATVDWALGRHADALRNLRAALATTDLPADMREGARKDIDAAYAATGHIHVRTDAGATVAIDGVRIEGLAPLAQPVDVEPGPHIVEAHLDDGIGRAQVDAEAAVVVDADVFVTVASVPQAPLAPLQAPAVAPYEASAPLEPRSPSFWSSRRIVGTIAVAAGLASIAVGAVYFGAAIRDENRATAAAAGLGPSSCVGSAQPAACSALNDASSAEWTDGQTSRALIGLGAVAAVAGAALVFWPERLHVRGISLRATAAPTVAGGSVAGSF